MNRSLPFYLVDATYCRPPVFGLLQAVVLDARGKQIATRTNGTAVDRRSGCGEIHRLSFRLRLGTWEGGVFRDESRFRFDPHTQHQANEVIAILDRTRRERLECAIGEGWVVVEEGWKGDASSGLYLVARQPDTPSHLTETNGFHPAAEIVSLAEAGLLAATPLNGTGHSHGDREEELIEVRKSA